MKAFASAVLFFFLGAAFAQDYPSKPIRLVIPFGPGSLADAVPRLMQPALEAKLGQRIVIDHRPGAGGNVGAQAVVSAPPDGYTLMMAATNNLVINQYLFRDMQFDPLQDLAPISLVVEVPLILQVNPSLPAQTLKEFIAHARAHPGKLNFASPSPGTLPHLAMEILARTAGLKLVHVPYKGGAPLITALLGGEIQSSMDVYATARAHIASGKFRLLGVASDKRFSLLPETPTLTEQGYPVEGGTFFAILGPAKMPRPVVETLNREINRALQQPEVRQRLTSLGTEIAGGTPEQLAQIVQREVAKWHKVVKDSNLKFQ